METKFPITILETCLYVNDLEKARWFYSTLFGFEEISYVPGRHVFFRIGKSVLLFFHPGATKKERRLPPHWATGRQHVAFGVPSHFYETLKTRVSNAGISILHEEHWGNGKSFYFHDPNGLLVEVAEPQIWGFKEA